MRILIYIISSFGRSIVCLLAAVMLSACGGSGGNSVNGGTSSTNSGSTNTSGSNGGGSSGSYTVGGTISGLSASGLVLTDNGGDTVSEPAGAIDFTFQTALANGSDYSVAVATQPVGEICSVTNGTGTINDSDVKNVEVYCSSNNNTNVSETILHSFTGGTNDGVRPVTGVVIGPTGALYGMTNGGGAFGLGVVFEITASGGETVLHSFAGGSDGAFGGAPNADALPGSDGKLGIDSAGNLYGTTPFGGEYGTGTVFEVASSGNESVLHSFGQSQAYPQGGVVIDTAGDIYGTTPFGGPNGFGTVFKFTPSSGTMMILHSFPDKSGGDGTNPNASLVVDSTGNIYGTTSTGGAYNHGTVFTLTASGTETVLYSFAGGSDGATPTTGLLMDTAGNLYGTTTGGGPYGAGTVFKVTSSGTETVLYAFTGGSDGATPAGELIADPEADLYGTTYSGGSDDSGTVFKLTPAGAETVPYSFTGIDDGSNPEAALAIDSLGNIYGTTSSGGANAAGAVFKLQP